MDSILFNSQFNEAIICFNSLLDDIILDICFEDHWKAKTGLINRPFLQEESSSISFVSSTLIICALCQEQVSGHRFAQHLEKCINGTKRNASNRRKQQQNNSNILDSSNSITTTTTTTTTSTTTSNSISFHRKKPRFSYGSLTIKIKLKNGVPIPNQRRTTVPSIMFINRSLATLPTNDQENEVDNDDSTISTLSTSISTNINENMS